MENKKLSKGLKRLLAAAILVAVLFILTFLVYAKLAGGEGDPELAGGTGVIKYHLKGILGLLTFSYAGASNVAYFALSSFLYAFVIVWLIFLVGGVVINDKKNTNIVWWGIVLTLVNLGVYVLAASGLQKFWLIVNKREAFEGNNQLPLIVLAFLLLGGLYVLLSLCFYFWTIFRAFLAGRPDEEENNQDVRAIVREELLKSQPLQVVVVNQQQPQVVVVNEEPEPEPVAEKEPEPVQEPARKVDFWEKAEEVWPQLNNPQPLPKEEKPEPVVVVVPQEEPEEESEEVEEPEEEPVEGEVDQFGNMKKRPREPFITRILKADLDIKANYNEIKNEILSYGVKSRLSKTGDVFRLHTKKYVKIFLVGKTLKVYLALNPEDYKDSTIPVEDVGFRPNYAEIPLLFKVRSGLSVRRCKELVKAACEKDGLVKKEVQDVNWVSELRTSNAEKAKEKKKEK